MIDKPRLIVTLRARYMLVAGSPPGLHIGIHLVTEAAKGGAFREFKKSQRENKECDDADDKRSLDCLVVLLSASLKTQENIKPKSFDQIINFS
jgi:hypothetical protein